MSIKNNVIATTTVFGIEARILEQSEGPLVGKSWVNFDPRQLRTLTDRQRKILEGADTALERGGVEGALAFLAEVEKWQAPE